jgi:Fic family protein
VLKDLIDTPILYFSKYIIRNKLEYYELFQGTRDTNNLEGWIIFILIGIEEMTEETISIISKIRDEIISMKHELRDKTQINLKNF